MNTRSQLKFKISTLKNYFFLFLIIIIIFIKFYYVSILIHNPNRLHDDSIQYLTQAHNLSQYQAFSQSYLPPILPDAQKMPGYAFFLYVFNYPEAIYYVQGFMSVLASIALAVTLRLLEIKQNIWLMVVWLVAPANLVFNFCILTEGLYISFMCYLLLNLAWIVYKPIQFWGFLTLGVLLTVLLMLKGLSLLLIIIIYSGIVYLLFKKKVYKIRVFLGLGLGIMVVVMTAVGWMYRNKQVVGNFTLTTGGDVALWYGRLGGILADDWPGGQPYPLADGFVTQPVWYYLNPSYRTQETAFLNPDAKPKAYLAMLQRPWPTIKLHIKAFFQMMLGNGYGTALLVFENKLLAAFLAAIQSVMNGLYFVVLGFYGILILKKRTLFIENLMLFMVMGLLVPHLSWWADGRYRVITEPVFLLLSALMATRLWPWIFGSRFVKSRTNVGDFKIESPQY